MATGELIMKGSRQVLFVAAGCVFAIASCKQEAPVSRAEATDAASITVQDDNDAVEAT